MMTQATFGWSFHVWCLAWDLDLHLHGARALLAAYCRCTGFILTEQCDGRRAVFGFRAGLMLGAIYGNGDVMVG